MTIETKGMYQIICKGKNGEAVLTRNFGNRDKIDKYSVFVTIGNENKQIATRMEKGKALALVEAEIDK